MLRLYSFLCSCLRTSYKGSRSKQNVNILPQGPKSQFFPQLPSSFTRNVSICFLNRIPVVDTTMLTSIFTFFMGAQLVYLGGRVSDFKQCNHMIFHAILHCLASPKKPNLRPLVESSWVRRWWQDSWASLEGSLGLSGAFG